MFFIITEVRKVMAFWAKHITVCANLILIKIRILLEFLYTLSRKLLITQLRYISHLKLCSFLGGGFTLYDVGIRFINLFLGVVADTKYVKQIFFLYRKLSDFLRRYLIDIFLFCILLFYLNRFLHYIDFKQASADTFNADVLSCRRSLTDLQVGLEETINALNSGNSIPESPGFFDSSSFGLSLFSLFILFVLFILLEAQFNDFFSTVFKNNFGGASPGGAGDGDDGEDGGGFDEVYIPEEGHELTGESYGSSLAHDFFGKTLFNWDFSSPFPNPLAREYSYIQVFQSMFCFKFLLSFFELYERLEGRRSSETTSLYFNSIKSLVDTSLSNYFNNDFTKLDSFLRGLKDKGFYFLDSILEKVESTKISLSDIPSLVERIKIVQGKIKELDSSLNLSLDYMDKESLYEELHIKVIEERVLFSDFLKELKGLISSSDVSSRVENLDILIRNIEKNMDFLLDLSYRFKAARSLDRPSLEEVLSRYEEVSELELGSEYFYSLYSSAYSQIVSHLSYEWIQLVQEVSHFFTGVSTGISTPYMTFSVAVILFYSIVYPPLLCYPYFRSNASFHPGSIAFKNWKAFIEECREKILFLKKSQRKCTGKLLLSSRRLFIINFLRNVR